MAGMKQYTVVATGKMRQVAYEKLSETVTLLDCQEGKLSKEELAERLAVADGVFSAGNVRIDAKFLDKCPKVKVIAQAAVGYDNVDVAECNKRGVRFGNTPGVLVEAVADTAYFLLLDSFRHFVQADAHVKSGVWGERKPFRLGCDLANKTLGIVGMGDIGAAIARRAQASCMKVIYHNRHQRPDDESLKVEYVEMEELLQRSDAIMIAVTLNPSTKGMFNAETISKMKDGAVLVNISRGAVVDSEALYEALQNGKLSHAALDVTDPEPLPGDHKLLSLKNITVTPHMASATKETRDAMALLTVDNLLAGLKGESLPAEVKA